MDVSKKIYKNNINIFVKIRNIHQFSLESEQNVWSYVYKCDQWKNGLFAALMI